MNQWWLDRWYGCQGQFHPYSSVLNTLGKYPGWEGDWISITGSDLSGTRQNWKLHETAVEVWRLVFRHGNQANVYRAAVQIMYFMSWKRRKAVTEKRRKPRNCPLKSMCPAPPYIPPTTPLCSGIFPLYNSISHHIWNFPGNWNYSRNIQSLKADISAFGTACYILEINGYKTSDPSLPHLVFVITDAAQPCFGTSSNQTGSTSGNTTKPAAAKSGKSPTTGNICRPTRETW